MITLLFGIADFNNILSVPWWFYALAIFVDLSFGASVSKS